VTESGWHRIAAPAPEAAATEIAWLPGWGQTADSLAPLARLLAARARNIVFDLPGFGRTPPLVEGAGSAAYADALIAELGPRSADRRILAGHSFGARVAIQAAARHPHAGALRMLGRVAAAADRLFGTRLRGAYSARLGSEDYRRAGPLRATLVSVVNEDLSAQAARIEVPVLLIYGAEDTATPPELGRRFAVLFGDAELHLLDGFGHLDILGNGAYQCQHLIERFLGRLE